MKFSTTKDVLLKGIQTAQSAINQKTSLPILSNILLEAGEEGVVLTATDLDMGIVVNIPIKPSVAGAITMPAKKFYDIIRELPDAETITVSVKKNNMIYIECEKNSFKVMGLPKEEFPQLPEFKNKEAVILPQKKLKAMLKLTGFAVSHDEARYVLNGVLLVIKPAFIRVVATDGRRLAMIEEKIQLPKTLERKLIIPAKTAGELDKLLQDEGDVKIYFAENQIFCETDKVRLISRLVEGEFPNYEQVVPKETKDKVVVNREKLLAAIKRAALFTNPDSMAVKTEVSRDKMVLSKSSPYLGEARIEIDADYKGKDITVGFNPDYLIDLLKNMSQETVALELSDADKPGVIRMGPEYVYVVLPMQLG